MGELRKVTGIVLSSLNVGEYDKRVVILTKERGKIAVYARGARRMGSPYTAACQSFAYGEFAVFDGKSYNLNGAVVEDYFSQLREDLGLLYTGLYFCETADYFTVEGNDELAILKLLYVSLSALRKGEMEPELIRIVYEIRLLAEFGLMMETARCVNCAGTAANEDGCRLTGFQSQRGGVVCEKCAKGLDHVVSIQESTLYTLQYIVSQPVTKLYHFRVTPQVLQELKRVAADFVHTHVNHTFKSMEFLEFHT